MPHPNPPASTQQELLERIAWRVALPKGTRAERIANWQKLPSAQRVICREAAKAILREVDRFRSAGE